MVRLRFYASLVVLSGCANCGEGGGGQTQPVETVDAASVAEGQLGHQLTAIPQARPQTNELHSVTLGQRNDGGGDAAH